MIHYPQLVWNSGGSPTGSDRSVAAGARAFARDLTLGHLEVGLRRLAGRRPHLEPYAEVTRGAVVLPAAAEERREVPVAAIVGSVGRAGDFSASFRPLHPEDEERWARVHAAVMGEAGLPPVQLLAVGGAYYVVDGHHRVSVLRGLGAPSVEAFVRSIALRPLPLLA
jgi:hypothetical protein